MLGQLVERSQLAELTRRARQRGMQWLDIASEHLAADYDRRPFLLRHRLAAEPRFEFDRIAALCRRRPDLVLYRRGRVPVTEDFARSFDNHGAGCSLDELLTGLRERSGYLMVSNAERDDEYRGVMEEILGEIALATEARDPGITWYSTYIFLSAEASLTPYHMDRELNFLLQIRGEKCVQLWDRADPEVMTAAQKDELLAYASEQRPPFRESFAHKAQRFVLRPGLGLHHPFIAPHVVETTSDLSISLAFTWRTRRTDRWTAAHTWNHRMRRLGLRPLAAGEHPLLDRAKSAAMNVLRQVKKTVRPRPRPQDDRASEAGAS